MDTVKGIVMVAGFVYLLCMTLYDVAKEIKGRSLNGKTAVAE